MSDPEKDPTPETTDEGSPGGAQLDDPNRESVGLDPIWTDAENPPLPDGEPETTTKKSRKTKTEETETTEKE